MLLRWLGVSDVSGPAFAEALNDRLSYDNERDEEPPLARLQEETGFTDRNKLLMPAFLAHLATLGTFTATRFDALEKQLVEALDAAVSYNPDRGEAWETVANICLVLSGCAPESREMLSAIFKLFHIPLLFEGNAGEGKSPSRVEAFIQLSLCVFALRSPSLILVPPSLTSSRAGLDSSFTSRRKVSAAKRELKQAGDSVDALRDLVMQKQREVDSLSTRLQKLDHVAKDERFRHQKQVQSLEEQMGGLQTLHQVQNELAATQSKLEAERRRASMDAEQSSSYQSQLADVTEELQLLEAELAQARKQVRAEPPRKRLPRRLGTSMTFAYLPWMLLIFTGGCIAAAYVWALYTGSLANDHIPFISQAIDQPPESGFGSLFLSITAVMLLFCAGIRWRLTIDSLDELNLRLMAATRRYHRLNILSLLCAFVGSISLMGVGAFQISTVPVPHLVFGGLFFLFTNLWLTFNLRLDWRLTTAQSLRVVRLVLVSLCYALLVGVTVLYFLDSSQAMQDARSVMEILLTFFLFVNIVTLSTDLASIELTFDARKLNQSEIRSINANQAFDDSTPLLLKIDE